MVLALKNLFVCQQELLVEVSLTKGQRKFSDFAMNDQIITIDGLIIRPDAKNGGNFEVEYLRIYSIKGLLFLSNVNADFFTGVRDVVRIFHFANDPKLASWYLITRN